jgi:glycosyltransferase involved in cell wall biosynthesis
MPQTEETERRYVLWVANFYALKRPQMLLEVARQIPECKFVMVGSPVDAEADVYRDAVAAVEHLPNVEIRGPVPYSEVGSIYSEAFAFTCTSVIEGFPNTYLDALSRRVPVIATFDPDEIICRHRLGFHCQTSDEMVASLRNLLADPKLRVTLGENGWHYVRSTHAVDVVRNRYDDLLAKLMRGSFVPAEPVCGRPKQGDSIR